MNWFKRKKEPLMSGKVQLRSGERHPFGMLADYVPLQNGELQLYRAVREAVPVVDAAIYKLIRMTGGVSATCQNPTAQRQLQAFLRTVPTGRGQQGINAFLDCYLDSLLVCGRAIGEIVPARGGRDIAALLCGRADCIDIREGTQPLEFCICGPDEAGRMEPLPFQNLLLFTPFHPEAEHPYGVSLMRSLPFLTDILMKIYHTIGVNWERCGNVRFAVTCRDGGNGQAAERSRMLASEWSQAMQETKQGSVRDFVAVGDVDIRVIGGDAPILDSEVPVRQILEQVVAKTGIPPFMLGLNWSSTERMSAQQADLLTTEITAIRRALTPTVERICRLWLRMHGFTCGYEVVWDDINLQDEVEEAKAQLYLEQARKLRIENDAAEHLRPVGGNIEEGA
ncbi:serine/threonine protein phosphatase [uncultured Oscillibacter sp.]|uniref:serine/threonine protein phosphatase n=1 Tax=uncultured Oscillibacter sp. TaxID=876091 RepID=UPI0025EDBB14|nr:serine/threonine protein phosphatase [uncultured Oscillibacter sp.]